MGAKDVTALVKELRQQGYTCEMRGGKWHVTNPATGRKVAFSQNAHAGRSLDNYRTRVHQLGEPPLPIVIVDPPPEPASPESLPKYPWSPAELLAVAQQQGVTVSIRGGLLELVCPPGTESICDVLRKHEADIVAALSPPAPSEKAVPDMPRIRDVAHVNNTAQREDVARDAEALWEIVRERAREQGDRPGTNAGIPGVPWVGAMNQVIAEFASTWDTEYRRRVNGYLEQSGNAKCQRKDARPPVWWIRDSWDDGGLTVKSVTSDPRFSATSNAVVDFVAQYPRGVTAKQVRDKFGENADTYLKRQCDAGRLVRSSRGVYQVAPAAAPTPAVLAKPKPAPSGEVNGHASPSTRALAFLQQMDLRIADAEKRAEAAEEAMRELEAERDAAVTRAEKAETELAQINALFSRVMGGGS